MRAIAAMKVRVRSILAEVTANTVISATIGTFSGAKAGVQSGGILSCG